MTKTFYQFLMKFRHPMPRNSIERFANDAFLDHGFPKRSVDYHELSSYLELNGTYLSTMSIFDDAWEMYHTENERRLI